jgi:hypothetical protein
MLDEVVIVDDGREERPKDYIIVRVEMSDELSRRLAELGSTLYADIQRLIDKARRDARGGEREPGCDDD